MVNEGAHILEEGIASRGSDIDAIYFSGYGFPAYRGGPMWYANTVGLKRVADRIESFGWQAAPLLKRLASEGKAFE
jgi:3-hydroxyacyl-CoA dehydrogenase